MYPEIQRLNAKDADTISALAIRSKAHWDYTPAQMAVFRNELTLSAADLQARPAFGLISQDRLIGFYTLVRHTHISAELEHLFVDPEWLGRGFGSMLLHHALSFCRSSGLRGLVILSDPNAAMFHERTGARLVREIPSSIPGRLIPEYRIDIEQTWPSHMQPRQEV